MVRVRRASRADADWILAEHIRHYRAVERFDDSFPPQVAQALDIALGAPEVGVTALWVAEEAGVRLGCILCSADGPEAARIRLFYVVPHARGQGVSVQLLQTLSAHARGQGCTMLRVSTFAEHAAACAFYARHGFVRQSRKALRAFGRELTLETWQASLEKPVP